MHHTHQALTSDRDLIKILRSRSLYTVYIYIYIYIYIYYVRSALAHTDACAYSRWPIPIGFYVTVTILQKPGRDPKTWANYPLCVVSPLTFEDT